MKKQKHKRFHSHSGNLFQSQQKRRHRWIWGLVLAVTIPVVSLAVYVLFVPAGQVLQPIFITVSTEIDTPTKREAVYHAVQEQIVSKQHIAHPTLYRLATKMGGMKKRLHRGRFRLTPSMSIAQIYLTLTRSGQAPIELTLHAIRTQTQLVEKIATPLEMSQQDLANVLQDSTFLASLGFDTLSIRAVFLPDSYEFYWDISPQELVRKFVSYYRRFWTTERLAQAQNMGLTPLQVTTLASIVESESNKQDEYSIIAGLYINRLRHNMKLQADPTVKFAIGDFSIRRITAQHTQHPSPYNTYLHEGLPPAPIAYPQASTIDSVLNYRKHTYLYMCAKEDFSGYHVFATTYPEHQINARKYQDELNKRQIH